jgi:hypothetical protein
MDGMVNIGLAKDSKEIAAASKRDSSAMKIVAVLTTAFLPGTFMAVSCKTHPTNNNLIDLSLSTLTIPPPTHSSQCPSLTGPNLN